MPSSACFPFLARLGRGRLADAPVVRRGGAWWLVGANGAMPADPALTADLDRFAQALAAADRATARLRRAGRPVGRPARKARGGRQ